MSNKKIFIQSILAILFCFHLQAQNPSALYQNWLDAQTNNTTPILPTFSFAGYKNGEVPLPSTFTQQIYDVTKSPFNAIPDDEISDKPAIMAAIAAAEANPKGGIVFFPPGRFIINDAATDNRNQIIQIKKSNIVLQGSGSGKGGTELYQKDNTEHPNMATQPWVCPYLIQFNNNQSASNPFITNVTANASRETYTVQVASTASIVVGQWIELYVKNTSSTFVAEEIAPYSVSDFFNPTNLEIVKNGVEVREIHKVVSKTANTITFKEPLHKEINAAYNWKINRFIAIEEVGIQDLKYTGGYVFNFLHHRAPQELYPGEAANGPHAYLSDSGWSGIQFNHVVNGWIKNVTFSAMSQGAQFKLSGYCTAFDNSYIGKPGHNFISANAATGNFIGKNIDKSTGIYHGSGVTGPAIGNVLWRNEHPTNGNSGMENHASQPRSTLFDVCKGGFFYRQGGSTAALPNHLRNMVLWNFNGISYKSTFVKSWRPNSETNFSKFLMPIISGLKGFTMATSANQFQENESQGKQVDETSLYEHQLAYRLGSVPNWLSQIDKSKILYSEDFSANLTRGYTQRIINADGHPEENALMKPVSDVPDETDSFMLFDDVKDREAIRIPNGSVRNQRAISISGSANNTNYAVNAYAVFTTLNLSKSNPLREKEDDYVYATFWTQRRFGEGDIANVSIEISTNYTGTVLDATWTTLPLISGKLSSTSDNRNYVKGVVDLTAYANSPEGSNITLAIHYVGNSSAFSSENRNGTFYISDLQYITQPTPFVDVWSGNSDSSFSNPANWMGKVAPTSSLNSIRIPSGLSNYPTTQNPLTASEIILESGATFIAASSVNANVTYKRELEIPAETGNTTMDNEAGWYLIASPVSGQLYGTSWFDSNEIAFGSGNFRGLATYNNSLVSNNWVYADGSELPFHTGKGYALKRNSTGAISFTGTMNTFTINNAPISVGLNGYNLLGNPFTSFINSAQFLSLTSNSSLLDSETLWVWDSKTKNYIVKLSGDEIPFKIAPSQGFFVKAATSGNITFQAAIRSHETTDTFLKTSLSPKITVNIASEGIERFAKINYSTTATTGFDNGFDGETFSGATNSLDIFSTLVDGSSAKKYQVQSIPNENFENMVIPLGIVSSSEKNITFTIRFENLPSGHQVYLEDKLAQKVTEFSSENANYQFTVGASETLGRFFLHLRTTAILSTTNEALNGVQVYKTNENELRMIGLNDENVELSIYTILGQKVFHTHFKGAKDNRISLPKLSKGMYIVNLKTQNGELNKKILMD